MNLSWSPFYMGPRSLHPDNERLASPKAPHWILGKEAPTCLLSCLFPAPDSSRLTWAPGIEEDVDLIVGVKGQQELASL